MRTQRETPTLEQIAHPGAWDTFSPQPGEPATFLQPSQEQVQLFQLTLHHYENNRLSFSFFLFTVSLIHSPFLLPIRHKYEFLHNGWSPELRITVNPVRVGVALDYRSGTLSFFNVDLKQHLHTFHCHFQDFVQPCFSLENPGALTVHTGIDSPQYTVL